jgi:RNA polymerase sigma-70 factor (ECF subfamily)
LYDAVEVEVRADAMTFLMLNWWFGGSSAGPPDGTRAGRRPQAAHPLPTPASGHADAAIVARIRSGDVAAFEACYTERFAALWRFARTLTGSADVANDVVQDVFVSVWVRREQLVVQTTIPAYLYGAVRRRAMREHRRDAIIQRSEALADPDTMHGLGEPPLGPDAHVAARDRCIALEAAIRALPDRQRAALRLWLIDDLSSAEIAECMDISERAVRKLLAKGRGTLSRFLPSELAAE